MTIFLLKEIMASLISKFREERHIVNNGWINDKNSVPIDSTNCRIVAVCA
jgi:hypothetical protein